MVLESEMFDTHHVHYMFYVTFGGERNGFCWKQIRKQVAQHQVLLTKKKKSKTFTRVHGSLLDESFQSLRGIPSPGTHFRMNAFQSTLSLALPAKRLRIDMKHSNWVKQIQRILQNHVFTFRVNMYIPKPTLGRSFTKAQN